MQSDTRTRSEPPAVHRLLAVLAAADVAGPIADAAAIDFARPVPAAQYSAVIGPVPFAGTIESNGASAELRALARSRRGELLAIAWALLALKEGGRLALIVPESVLDGDTQAHHALRRRLVEENALQAVIGMRAGIFRARTRAAILIATRGGATERVGFHRLDAARDIPALLARWPVQRDAPGAVASLFVRREEIRPPQFTLAMDRYRSARPGEEQQPRPHELLQEIAGLEAEILQGIRDLVGMLK
ncbi:MAG: N-6 DNA methylase [Burkholderiales bacterium]